jgi:hypothetical protein
MIPVLLIIFPFILDGLNRVMNIRNNEVDEIIRVSDDMYMRDTSSINDQNKYVWDIIDLVWRVQEDED